MPLSFANARYLWEGAAERARAAAPADRRAVEAVVDLTVLELRRRLGGVFTIDELIALWEQGIDWVLEIAVRAAPGTPAAWDAELVAGAAFWRYARDAQDFAGGRRQTPERAGGRDMERDR